MFETNGNSMDGINASELKVQSSRLLVVDHWIGGTTSRKWRPAQFTAI